MEKTTHPISNTTSPVLSDTIRFDYHFARFFSNLAQNDNQYFFYTLLLLSSSVQKGNICIDLKEHAASPIPLTDTDVVQVWPTLSEWLTLLQSTSIVGKPGEYCPLILADSRFYLYRYWEYEHQLAINIRKIINWPTEEIDGSRLISGLSRLFPDSSSDSVDWQKVAAVTAVLKRFTVISGGPGTGKTSTVVRILTLLLEQHHDMHLRIALATPTGKAAARLKESIINAVPHLDCSEEIKEQIPREAATIHRLLGTIPDSPYFRHNKENRLPYDVVVIDEASMVDLALMSKLVQALPDTTHLILLGDKNQLASVEAGAVLGDICDTGRIHSFSPEFSLQLQRFLPRIMIPTKTEPPMADSIVTLHKSYRFSESEGIGAASKAVIETSPQSLLDLPNDSAFVRRSLPRESDLLRHLRPIVHEHFGTYIKEKNPVTALRLFERFRILCALRNGPYGVTALNNAVEVILRSVKLLPSDNDVYPGKPIIITRNDYEFNLFNGDIGTITSDPSNGILKAAFPSPDGTVRLILPNRLPPHETVYAMTVHKSQGSEFDRVLFVLPSQYTPLLTRELIYTGITRARKNVELWSTPEIIQKGLATCIERQSGLRNALWE